MNITERQPNEGAPPPPAMTGRPPDAVADDESDPPVMGTDEIYAPLDGKPSNNDAPIRASQPDRCSSPFVMVELPIGALNPPSVADRDDNDDQDDAALSMTTAQEIAIPLNDLARHDPSAPIPHKTHPSGDNCSQATSDFHTIPSISSFNSLDSLADPFRESTLRRRRWRSYSDEFSDSNPTLMVSSPRLNYGAGDDESETTIPKCHPGEAAHKRQHPRAVGRAGRRHKRSRWLIRAANPCKILWDICTFALSLASILATHQSIRDRKFILSESPFLLFCEVWFVVDMLLNFVTEYRRVTDSGELVNVRDERAVWARYLTTWFVVDLLSLVPWESLYVQPVIDRQNRRNFFLKSFFRTKAVIRVTRLLRGRHFRLFGQVARKTKHAGVGARRLLRLLIKYVPKYLLFYRNMKGILAVRVLRQLHWVRKLAKNIYYYKRGEKVNGDDNDNDSLTAESSMDDDDRFTNNDFGDYWNWGGDCRGARPSHHHHPIHVSWQPSVADDDDDYDEGDDLPY